MPTPLQEDVCVVSLGALQLDGDPRRGLEELQASSAVQPTLRRRSMSGPQKLAMLASLDDLAAEHSRHEHEDPSRAKP